MKKQLFIALTLIIFTITGFAQQKLPTLNINSSEIIEKAQEMDFSEAKEILLTIPLGDTLYNTAQMMLGKLHTNNKQYEDALKYCMWVLEHPNSKVSEKDIIPTMAECYYYLNDYNTAIFYFNKALEYFPYKAYLHNNLAQCYMQLEMTTKAEEHLILAIRCEPFNNSFHYQLALTYLKQRQTIPALLALNFSSYCEPSHAITLSSLQLLDEIYTKGTEVFYEENKIPISDNISQHERFMELEMLINSNFAISSKFKAKTKIKHILPYQNQLLFEMLPTPNNSNNIVDLLYIPLFKKIVEENYSDFCYYQLQETDVEDGKVRKKALKMSENLTKFVYSTYPFALQQVSKGINIKENETSRVFEYENQGALSAFGESRSEVNGKYRYDGLWHLVKEDGSLKLIGEIKNNVNHGITTLYHNSKIIERLRLQNDTLEGRSYRFFDGDTNLIETAEDYQHGEINGERIRKNRYGITTEISQFKDNYFHGLRLQYSNNGTLTDSTDYNEGYINKFSYNFYENGKIEAQYNTELTDQLVQHFYPNGALAVEEYFVDGVISGNHKAYYANGKLKSVGNYNELGNKDGYWTSYYRNGETQSETHFENDKPTNEQHFYLPSQIKSKTYTWKDGKIVEVVTYYPDGSVRARISPINNCFEFDLYNGYNIKDAHCCINEEGEPVGTNYLYYENGNIKQKEIIDKNSSHTTLYNIDGTVDEIYISKGDYNEYYSFYNNGNIFECYAYKDNQIIGTLYRYAYNGKPFTIMAFNEGSPLLTKEFFDDGTLRYIEELKFGNMIITQSFNLEGEIVGRDTLLNENGVQKIYNPNGTLLVSIPHFANTNHGWKYQYDINGNTIAKTNFLNGKIEGEAITYHPNGKIETITNYILDNKEGWYYGYDDEGNLLHKYYYENNELQDTAFIYNHLGKIAQSRCYLNNQKEGATTYYSADGKPACVLIYDRDRLMAYQYMQKNQKMSEIIPFTNDSIQIIAYYANGNISCQLSFFNRMKISEIKYYNNGSLSEKTEYQNNLRHGNEKKYYPNEKLFSEKNYIYSNLDGEAILYFPNGNIKTKNFYKYGIMEGEQLRYNTKGEIISTTTYKNGTQIK